MVKGCGGVLYLVLSTFLFRMLKEIIFWEISKDERYK